MSKAREIISIIEMKIPKTTKSGVREIEKIDKLLSGWKRYKPSKFDKASSAWVKGGKVISTMLYPPNSYNVSIATLTANVPDDPDQMFFYKNTKDRKILQNFGKVKKFNVGGKEIDKWEYLRELLK